MRDLETLARLCALAEDQWGLVTAAQAHEAGVPAEITTELHAAGVIEPVLDGVWRVRAGAHHPMPRSYARWLLLSLQPGPQRIAPGCGVVSHASAARLYGLAYRAGTQLQVSVPAAESALAADRNDVAVHATTLDETEFSWLLGMPVTSPERTLIDLLAAHSSDVAELGTLAAGFLAGGWTDRASLAAALTRSGYGGVQQDVLLGAAEE